MNQAKNGDRVKIHYTGKTGDGQIFASSQGDDPIEFTVGEGMLLPGIENAVQGMSQGEQKVVNLSPEEGFGTRLDELVIEVDREQFPTDFEPEVGMHLQVPQPDGSTVVMTILSIDGPNVRLDANHPLAGQSLVFELEVVAIA